MCERKNPVPKFKTKPLDMEGEWKINRLRERARKKEKERKRERKRERQRERDRYRVSDREIECV